MAEKYFISAKSLQYDSFLLAKNILDSGFRPDFIVGLWRGGTPPGIYVHDFLAWHGINSDHIPIRTSRYHNNKVNQEAQQKTKVYGLEYVIDHANAEDSLLLVDDVWDKGLTICDVLEEIKKRARKNTPQSIKVATVYFKPLQNKTNQKPDFYVHEIDKWIVFPHECQDHTWEEIREGKGENIANLFKKPA